MFILPAVTNHHRTGVTETFSSPNGVVTLRYAGKLRHIPVGRANTGTRVLLLIQDDHVTVLNTATGEVIRELTIDPNRDYQALKTNNA